MYYRVRNLKAKNTSLGTSVLLIIHPYISIPNEKMYIFSDWGCFILGGSFVPTLLLTSIFLAILSLSNILKIPGWGCYTREEALYSIWNIGQYQRHNLSSRVWPEYVFLQNSLQTNQQTL